MKRKSEAVEGARNGILKSAKQKRAKESKPIDITGSFRDGLFDAKNLKSYTQEYAASAPYKHAVIHDLMNDSLLRAVRTEVRENVHFTPKETDIYKIHQSGDLANLDGLDDAALERLPSLLKLRDALYSPAFRKYAEAITGAGALSGKKTDMAINVYTPGCHLLCHDDVIGSRRISYILYLPDPDIPWKEEWGGALRLYPTTKLPGGDGEVTTVPSADFAKSIPPAWNQLSFFAVQPGLSFHDVEEVYHAPTAAQQEKEGGRVRMAISGWFHIPQEGEEGYIPGAEENLALKSSLVQLQGKADEYDFPKETPHPIPAAESAPSPSDDDDDEGLEAEDIDFLLKYLTPTYLTPDTIEQVNAHFQENSAVSIDQILSAKFSARLRAHLETAESSPLPATAAEIEACSPWRVAKPPHKHRFLYLEPSAAAAREDEHKNPVQELVDDLLPSREFRKWLAIATGCGIRDFNVLGRRFRRGKDYALATSHEGEPRLEVCLAFTPTKGWGVDDDEEEEEEEEEPKEEVAAKGKKGKKAAAAAKAKADAAKAAKAAAAAEEDDVGGHEVYMAAEDDDDSADAAIYKATTGDEEDNVLFTVPAAWNKMSIVLRDEGVLRFVKYVSRNAKGDRWDVSGLYGVDDEDDEGENEGDEDGVDDEDDEDEEDEEGSEEEFEGFSD